MVIFKAKRIWMKQFNLNIGTFNAVCCRSIVRCDLLTLVNKFVKA